MTKIGSGLFPPERLSSPHSPWFHRRPFFWWALAAIGCVHLGYASPITVWVWVALGFAGVVLALTLSRELGATLAVGALFGALVSVEKIPPFPSHLREGAAVTMRGVVRKSGRAGQLVLQVEHRLTAAGWVREPLRLGVRAEEGPLPVGARLEVSGLLRRPLPATNPGGFDDRIRWLQDGVHRVLKLRPGGLRRLGQEPAPLWRGWADRLRAGVLRRNQETLSPTGALIANSFLLGAEESPDAELSASIAEAFRDSGTLHLLVVSGTQVSLIMAGFIWMGWRVWPARFLFWGLGALAVGGFWLLTDGGPSVSRAALMGTVVVLGLALNREPDGENCLGIAALALLSVSRFAAFDIGAQLSFAAVWGLIRLAPPLYRALGPAGEGAPGSDLRLFHAVLAGSVAASVAAYLATAPILAFHFQRVSWSGLLANLPMMGLAGLFTYAAVGHAAVPVLGPVVDYGASSFTGWAGFFSQPPFGAREVFPFPLWLFPLYYTALALPSLAPRSRRVPGALVLGLGAVLFLSERLPAPPPSRTTLRAIDVGQGDAILLQSPGGAHILVDAGKGETSRGAPALVRALRGLRVGTLDAVVVSHADSDHTGGLPRLLEHVPVRLLIQRVDPEPEEAELWGRVLRTAARLRIPTTSPRAGDRLRVRDTRLTFLGPLRATHGNEASLVFRWDAAGARFLLTGDAGHPSERELLAWGPELRSDVLKAGHHGSNGSTGPEWLAAVQPRLAVLSCGRDNRFGHPAPPVLERLRAAGAAVARTDQSGMVTVQVDLGEIQVQPWLPP